MIFHLQGILSKIQIWKGIKLLITASFSMGLAAKGKFDSDYQKNG